MLQAIKIKLYPNHDQKIYINKSLGVNRFVYNKCLEYKINEYKATNKTVSNSVVDKFVNHQLKNEFTWIKETNSKVIQQTLQNLDTAYNNFFRDLASGKLKEKTLAKAKRDQIKIAKLIKQGKPIPKKKDNDLLGFPNFKCKHNPINLRFPADAISGTRSSKKSTICGNRINIVTQLKNILFKCSRQDEIKLNKYQKSIKSGTLSKDKTGDFYFSILIDIPVKKFKTTNNNIVGIDLGIKNFVITSEGQFYENLNFSKRQDNKLKRLHKNLSKKQKGSNNKEKARIKLAKLNKKINNQKEYYLHSVANQLLSENQTIVIESLNVDGMLKNHKLAKAIQEMSWSRFTTILKYKANWYNREIIEIDRFFPSSKKCNNCGNNNDDLKLSDREWICPSCGTHLDRDINAAINIKNEGIRLQKNNRDELDRINASGVQVNRPTKKEETNRKSIETVIHF